MPKSRFNMYVIDLCYSKGQGRLRHFFKESRSTLWCDRLWRVEEVCVCGNVLHKRDMCPALWTTGYSQSESAVDGKQNHAMKWITGYSY